VSWADRAAPIIAEVLRQNDRTDLPTIRKALAEAYPWGARQNRPYKAWLSEIRRQLGHPLNAPKLDLENGQIDMFNETQKG
jgi:hypothetical protein